MVEIGSSRALIQKIQTTIDGGFRLTLDILPQDQEILSKLLKRYALGERIVEVGIIAIDRGEAQCLTE